MPGCFPPHIATLTLLCPHCWFVVRSCSQHLPSMTAHLNAIEVRYPIADACVAAPTRRHANNSTAAVHVQQASLRTKSGIQELSNLRVIPPGPAAARPEVALCPSRQVLQRCCASSLHTIQKPLYCSCTSNSCACPALVLFASLPLQSLSKRLHNEPSGHKRVAFYVRLVLKLHQKGPTVYQRSMQYCQAGMDCQAVLLLVGAVHPTAVH